jgi:wobble nucleotide-excising tRNase
MNITKKFNDTNIFFVKINDIMKNIQKKFHDIDEKIKKINIIYNSLMIENNDKLNLYGLDTLKFQSKLFKLQFESCDNMYKVLNNRIYGDYFKLYKIIINTCINSNIQELYKKKDIPNSSIELQLTEIVLSKINLKIKAINIEIEDYNNKIMNKKVELEIIKTKFWSLMRWDYDNVIKEYKKKVSDKNKKDKDFESKIKEIDQKILDYQKIIRNNEKLTVNIDMAVDNINAGLINIGISDFKIEKCLSEDFLYHLKREKYNENTFKTLSEGEKMIISFLYFIESCKGKTDINKPVSEKIIVIDDPISSLSHIYVFNIGRLIHNEFLRSNKYKQIFILTHSLYFFYELTDTNKERRKINQKLFRLQKNQEGSSFIEMDYEEIQNDYHAYWTVIKDKKQHPALIANCMRNIIDYFFNFVEKKDFNNVFQKELMKSNKFEAFNRYMNRESHSLGQNIFDIKEFDYDDFREAFRLVFKTLKYEEHYNKMIK